MAAPLQSAVVQIPIQGGLNQEMDERVLPVGSLTTAKNISWNKLGAVEKRPGFPLYLNTSGLIALASTGDDPITGKELCGISRTGDFYSLSAGSESRGKVSPCTVSQMGVWTDVVDWAAGDVAESATTQADPEDILVIHSSCGSYHTSSPSSESTRRLGVWAEIRNRKDEVIYPRQLLMEGVAGPNCLAACGPRNVACTDKLLTLLTKYSDTGAGFHTDDIYVFEFDETNQSAGNTQAYSVHSKWGIEAYLDYTISEKHFNVRTYDACRVDSGSHEGTYLFTFIERSSRAIYVIMLYPNHTVLTNKVITPSSGTFSRVAIAWDSTNNKISLMARRDTAAGLQVLEAWMLDDGLNIDWGPVQLDSTQLWNNGYNELFENIGCCAGPDYPSGSNDFHIYVWGKYVGEFSQTGPDPGGTREWHIGWSANCASFDINGTPSAKPAYGSGNGQPARTRNMIPKSRPFVGTRKYGCYVVLQSCYHQEQTGIGCAKSVLNLTDDPNANFLTWVKIDLTATPPITEATCRRVGGSWLDAGFTVGQRVVFANAPHNNGPYTLTAVTHKTMTFAEDVETDVVGEDSTDTVVTGENASGNQDNPGEDRVYLFEHTSLFQWSPWNYTDGGGVLHRNGNTKLEFCGCWDIGLGNGIENSSRIYSKNDTMRIGSLQNVTRCQGLAFEDYRYNQWRMADVRRSDTVNANERETDTDVVYGGATLDGINYGQQHRFITTQCIFDFDAVPYVERTHRNLMLIGGATINCYDGLRIGDLGFAAPPVITNWINVEHAIWTGYDPATPPAFPPYPHSKHYGIWSGGTTGVQPGIGYHYVTMWMSVDNRGHLHRSMPSNQIDYTWQGVAPAYDQNCVLLVDKYDYVDDDQNLAILRLSSHALGSSNRGRSPDEVSALGTDINTPDGYAACYWFRSSETGISHRIGDPSAIRQNHVWQYFGLDDLLLPGYPDSGQVLEGPPLYTDSGEIEAVKPESSQFVLVANERVWIAGQATPERIQYSKKYGISAGGLCIAPEFNEGFAIGIPSGKACTGLARLDDKVIVFSTDEVYAIAGSGPLDDGSQNDLSQLTLVSDTFGCDAPNSIVSVPDGVFFKAKNGLCKLNRDLSVSMIHEVEDLIEGYPRIMSSCLWPEKELAVFAATTETVSKGTLVIYNYHFNTWSEWEILGDPRGGSLPVTPIALTVYDGHLVVSTTSDGIFISSDTEIRDHSTSWYTSSLATAWLQAATQGAWQRIRGVIVQSKPDMTAHRAGLEVNIYNDFQDLSASQTCTWTSDELHALPEPSRQDLYIKPIRQKCSSIKIEVSDLEPPVSAYNDAAFSICGFALDLGVKRGLTKVDALRRR